jgi:hypothetical protein
LRTDLSQALYCQLIGEARLPHWSVVVFSQGQKKMETFFGAAPLPGGIELRLAGMQTGSTGVFSVGGLANESSGFTINRSRQRMN